jgi:uncharacterized protein (DUF924 family)
MDLTSLKPFASNAAMVLANLWPVVFYVLVGIIGLSFVCFLAALWLDTLGIWPCPRLRRGVAKMACKPCDDEDEEDASTETSRTPETTHAAPTKRLLEAAEQPVGGPQDRASSSGGKDIAFVRMTRAGAESMMADNMAFKVNNKALKTNNKALKVKNKALQEENKALKADKALQEEKKVLQAYNTILHADKKAAQAHHETERQTLQGQVANLKAQDQTKLEEHAKEITALKSCLSSLEATKKEEVAVMQGKHNAVTEELGRANERNTTLEMKVSQLQNELIELEHTKEKIDGQKKALDDDRAAAKEQLETRGSELDAMTAKYDSLAEAHESLKTTSEQQAVALQEQLDTATKLTSERDKLKQTTQSLQEKLD